MPSRLDTRKRHGGRRVSALLLVSLAGIALVATVSEGRSAPVGGPPTHPNVLPPCPPGKKCTDLIVIGAGPSAKGRVEIVARKKGQRLCLAVDVFKLRRSGYGCTSELVPSGRRAVDITGASAGTHGSQSVTVLKGSTRPKVHKVVLKLNRPNGRVDRERGVFGRVSGRLQRSLDMRRSFGRFAVVITGCYEPAKSRLVAYGRKGMVVGRDGHIESPVGCER